VALKGAMSEDPKRCRRYDLVGFGISAVDDIIQLSQFPELDTKIPITLMERLAGGQCCSALVAAARQGLRCAYAGILGQNELSEFLRTTLARECIDVPTEVRYPDALPIHSFILLDSSTGKRTILYSNLGVRDLTSADVCESLVQNSRALLVDQAGPAGTLRACKLARKWGTQIVADFERMDSEHLHDALRYIDHLIVPMRLARELTGCIDPKSAVKKLAGYGRPCTAATDGDRGCWFVLEDGNVQHQPSFPVDVVDTTGCGDVFHGAYAAAIVREMPPQQAIEWATAAAALCATKRGGQTAIPDHTAIGRLLRQSESG
jgi:sulfofructose kinase